MNETDRPVDEGMELTLVQLLTLIGRLDDSPGFDTPRERFRRFLIERVTDVRVARSLIEQCLRAPGQQSHRALQDLVVLLGRFVGFEVVFGAYESAPLAAAGSGEWCSRRRMRLVVEVLTDHTQLIHASELSRRVFQRHADAEPDAEPPQAILGIMTPLFPSARLHGITMSREHPPLCALSLRGALHLGDLVASHRLNHDGVLAILARNPMLDAVVDLLQEAPLATVPASPSVSIPSATPHDAVGTDAKRHWMCRVYPDESVASEPFVMSVIGHRRILPVEHCAESRISPRTGDVICFAVDGAGTLGEAEVSDVLTDGSGLVRNPKRFSHVLRLANVVMYGSPRVDARRRAGIEAYLDRDRGTTIFLITAQQFRDLTNPSLERTLRDVPLPRVAEMR